MRPIVEAELRGKAGVIHYREGENLHTFDCELGAGDVLLSIYVPTPADWDSRIPWAAGRRQEILERIGRTLCRREFPPCRPEIAEHWIHLREARPPWRIVANWLRRVLRRR